MVVMSACIYAFMAYYFTARNRRRREGKEDGKITGMSEEEIAEMGDEK